MDILYVMYMVLPWYLFCNSNPWKESNNIYNNRGESCTSAHASTMAKPLKEYATQRLKEAVLEETACIAGWVETWRMGILMVIIMVILWNYTN